MVCGFTKGFLDFPERENLSGPYEGLLSPAVLLICVAAACLCVTERRLKGGDKGFRLRWILE